MAGDWRLPFAAQEHYPHCAAWKHGWAFWFAFAFVLSGLIYFISWYRVSLYSPGCPGMPCVDQTGFEFTELQSSICLCLPGSGIQGVCYQFLLFTLNYMWACMSVYAHDLGREEILGPLALVTDDCELWPGSWETSSALWSSPSYPSRHLFSPELFVSAILNFNFLLFQMKKRKRRRKTDRQAGRQTYLARAVNDLVKCCSYNAQHTPWHAVFSQAWSCPYLLWLTNLHKNSYWVRAKCVLKVGVGNCGLIIVLVDTDEKHHWGVLRGKSVLPGHTVSADRARTLSGAHVL